jgi:hypothetical protein
MSQILSDLSALTDAKISSEAYVVDIIFTVPVCERNSVTLDCSLVPSWYILTTPSFAAASSDPVLVHAKD